MCLAEDDDGGLLDKRTDGEILTDQIDAVGMFWLSAALYPLVAAWGLYSLLHYSQKGWWSWLIETLATGVYAFGFISMTPQLFINYKLKSVAHLPWRVFMYKAFNTFIDDVFSWMMVSRPLHDLCPHSDAVFLPES